MYRGYSQVSNLGQYVSDPAQWHLQTIQHFSALNHIASSFANDVTRHQKSLSPWARVGLKKVLKGLCWNHQNVLFVDMPYATHNRNSVCFQHTYTLTDLLGLLSQTKASASWQSTSLTNTSHETCPSPP